MSASPFVLRFLASFDRALREVSERTPTRVALFAALALLAKWRLLSSAGALTDFRDAHYFTVFEESARIAVAKFHQAPLWDPYYCGGIPALATPSARFASPTFALTLLFGTLRADALVAFFMTILGLEGAFRYLRARGATSTGAMFAAPIFALSGMFASAPPLGWLNFFGFELVPWVALGARLALRGSLRGAVLAALALAWIVGHGGTYGAPLAILLAIFEGVEALVTRVRTARDLPPMFAMSALVALLALGLAAARLWPIAELLSSSPRILGGTPGNTPGAILKYLFGESDTGYVRGAFLVGALALPIAITGFFLGVRRWRSPPMLGAISVWLWLAAGYTPKVSLFAALRTVPPFTMLRYPERFLALFALALAVLAAIGVSELQLIARRRPAWRFAWVGALGLLAMNTLILVTNDHWEAHDRALLPPPAVEDRDFKQSRGNRWVAAEYPWNGRGSLSCFDDYEVPQSTLLRGDLAHEEYLRDPADGEVVERRAWSPNRIDLHVSLTKPARVYVNQNWHPGWRASVGEVHQEDGLLVVDVPAGEHDVTLRFLPRSAVGGIAVSLAALLAAAILWRRARKTDVVEGGRAFGAIALIAMAPLLVGAVARASIHEPPIPPRPLRAPSGEDIVLSAAPEDSKRIDARFTGGILLEGARLEISNIKSDTSTLTLELDWRLAARAQKGLGIFVHVDGSPGDQSVNVDHALISSVLPFEDAPTDTTLRDISIPITLPASEEHRTWEVHVGLWLARRGGERVTVVDAGNAKVDDSAVLVGTFETP